MRIAQAVGKSIKLTISNIMLPVIFLVSSIITTIIMLPVQNIAPTTFTFSIFLKIGVLYLLTMVIGGVTYAGGLGAVKDILRGKSDVVTCFIEGIKKYYVRILLFTLLIFGVVAVPALLIGLLVMGGEILAVLGGILAVVIFPIIAIASIFVALAPYMIVFEDQQIVPAMWSSFNLIKKWFGELSGLFSVLMLAAFCLIIPFVIIFGIVAFALKLDAANNAVANFIMIIPIAFITVLGMFSFATYYFANMTQKEATAVDVSRKTAAR